MKNLIKTAKELIKDEITGYDTGDEMIIEFEHEGYDVTIKGYVTAECVEKTNHVEWWTEQDGYEETYDEAFYYFYFDCEVFEMTKPQTKIIFSDDYKKKLSGLILEYYEK